MTTLASFTKQYQVQKTLRFELIPQGKTQEHIDNKGFINEDEKRNENYTKIKLVIDAVHKKFIEHTLSYIKYDWQLLAEAVAKFRKDKSDENKKNLEKLQEAARKEIIAYFTGKQGSKAFKENQKDFYDKLFKKELFSDILQDEELNLTADEKEAIANFDRFTTYFTGFHENRRNMYSVEAKSTSVAYRLVNDNFAKFLSNCEAYTNLKKYCPDVIAVAENELHYHPAYAELVLDEVFNVDAYNNFLSQSKIDYYNQIIGGVSAGAGQIKLRGINEVVNNAMQQNAELKAVLKNKQFALVPLFKQILSDRSTLSFVAEQFNDDVEVVTAIENYLKVLQNEKVLKNAKEFFANFADFDASKIYIANKELSNVSLLLTKNWSKIREVVLVAKIAELGEKPTKKKVEAIEKYIKSTDFSIAELMQYETDFTDNEGKSYKVITIAQKILEQIEIVQSLSEQPLPKNLRTQENKAVIKTLLDEIENLLHLLNYFKVNADNDLDAVFYSEFDKLYVNVSDIIPLYNKVRNYATKKPYSTEKFKLNFAMPTLADGWDKNKESANGAIILLKDDCYYLGIMNPQNKPDIDGSVYKEGACYQKMVYKMFPDISKMVTKCSTQLNAVKNHFQDNKEDFILTDSSKFIEPLQITKEVFDLNNVLYDGKKKFQIDYLRNSGDVAGYHEALAKWIDFVKDFLRKYKSTAIYDFTTLLPTKHYEKLDVFYGDVDNICYKIEYQNISVAQVEAWVDAGQLYLFQIYNKDFAVGTTGKPNLHTMYWKSVFSAENMQDVVIKLNGGAELFYRPKSNMPKIEHKQGEKFVNRKTVDGKPIADEIYKEVYAYANGKLNKELSAEAKFILPQVVIKDVKHTITKDRRFLKDKYFFHVPLTLNYKADTSPKGFNLKVQEFLKNNPDINIVGIDRGERNLLYVVVIDQQGNIVDKKQVSYNVINNYDYYTKLDQREKERTKARQAWETVGKIKELKEGYLSLVVKEIADMMIKYNAIVVLENLNTGFKRVRNGIAEKAVYQKFEKMLIDKLNYLVFKDVAAKDAGGVLNAYQLTDKFDSFEKLGTQCGFLFYVPAAYTSKIDPVTGFANVLSTKHITNVEAKKNFICSFKNFSYDEHMDKFVLECDLDDFKALVNTHKKHWRIIIGGKRIVYNAKEKTYSEKYPAEDLKKVFGEYGIDYRQQDLLGILQDISTELKNNKLFDGVYWAIMNTLQMRNSNAQTGEDYIISAVADENGKVFDSRTCGDILPKDADANGAYHIALKGLYLLQQISAMEDGKKPEMKISNEDWFRFVQSKSYVR